MTNQFSTNPVEQIVGDDIADQLLALMAGAASNGIDERRIRERVSIHCKLRLTPIDLNEKLVIDEDVIAFGKDLSRRGISFMHDTPLLYRRAVIAILLAGNREMNVEAEITWTRETPIGLYESGCRLIRKLG